MTPVYRLTLPSGNVIRARKAPPLLLLGEGVFTLPLLAAAVRLTTTDDEERPKKLNLLKQIGAVCRIALVDQDVRIEWLTLQDQQTLYAWAMSNELAGAVPDGAVEIRQQDLEPLVKSSGCVLLDKIAQRYNMRPSQIAGVEDERLALDFDFAVGYRGIRHEGGHGDEEIDVEDAFGNTLKLPQKFLPEEPAGARKVNVDWYARRYKAFRLGAGGMGGDGTVGVRDYVH